MPLAPLAVLLAAPLAAQSPLYSFHGDSPGDEFGVAVSGAGDTNWDGYDDVIVGAHWDDDKGTDSGSARVFSGIDGSVLTTLYGDASGDFFGLAVASAGDVNGDLYADVIVGADGSDGNGVDSGMARVFSGKDWSVLYTWYGDNAGDQLGGAVASAGDVDGDGRDDLIVGMRTDDDGGTDSGSARVYSGKTGAVLFTFHGDSAGDLFGTSVGGGVDVNGDGTPDIVVGAPFDDDGGSDAGSVRVLSGFNGAVLFTIHGTGTGDRLGSSVDGLGDIDADGKAEFLAGAPRADSNGADAGLVWALSGATGAVVHEWVGEAAGDQLGASCGRAGDVDGDLKHDVVGGARLNDVAGNNAGAAYVWSAVSGSLLHTLRGGMASDWFGGAVAGAGDVDGDGLDDVVSGARLADVMGPNSGSVEVHAFPGPKNTWYVDAAATPPGLGTQAQPYASIQYAIDQPGTVSGDTVEIAAGTYLENIMMPRKSLALEGKGPRESVVLDGQYLAPVIQSTEGAADLSLRRLTITRGIGSTTPPGPFSGDPRGAGVLAFVGSLVVDDCIVSEGREFIHGGGVFFRGHSLAVTGSRVSGNHGISWYWGNGGGIYADGNAIVLDGCEIIGNWLFGRGGGVYAPSGLQVYSCIFEKNAATNGEGGAIYGSPIVVGSVFSENGAGEQGGAIRGEATATNCQFIGNGSEEGGAIWGFGDYSDCTFIENFATPNEEHILIRGGAAFGGNSMNDCLLVGNRVEDTSGFSWSFTAAGGAASGGRLTGCTLVNNFCAAPTIDSHACDYSILTDSIVWGSPVPTLSQNSVATYSNIEGGYPGIGNISADPLFFDPARDDYHLTALSPCIDAGDPMSPKDPDGSRADMGAYWFDPNYCPPTYTYCTAKTNSCGGTPAISATGSPIAGSSSGFVISSTGARQGKAGILMYSSNGTASLPFQGGTLCIAPQGLKRGPAVFATGGSGGSACDATFSIDWAAFASGAMGGNPPAFLSSPGQRVNVQWWGRDAVSVGSYLSDGLEYTVCP